MPSLAWSAELDNNLAPMDDTHREFVECYNVLLNIRHKYGDDELLRGQVDMTLRNEF